MCDWTGEGGIDRNLDEGVEMVEMKGFVLREEWMVSCIVVSEVIALVERMEEG